MPELPSNSRTLIRRTLGAACLLTAIGMLAADNLPFIRNLDPGISLGYWLICLFFILLAVYIALIDLRVMRGKNRREQHDLLERTLREIDRERQNRRQDP